MKYWLLAFLTGAAVALACATAGIELGQWWATR